MGSPLRIVFMGSDGIAIPMLEWLAGVDGATPRAQFVAVYTQPDRPVGRGQKVQPNAIKTWAQARGIPVYQPEKITDETRDELAGLNADVSLVMAYGHILRETFIATPRLGTLNLHASLLPKYRGASPIQTAVANGERETGVSLMRIIRKLDAGPVADIERVSIEPHDTALDIEAKLAAACVPLIARALPRLASGELVFHEQDESSATFCRRMEKTDGALDFTEDAAVLVARINGLFPWPACVVEIAGQPIKFGLAEVYGSVGEEVAMGCVLSADATVGLSIATGYCGVLRVLRLQRPGGKMMDAREFLRGFSIPAGTVLQSRPMPPLVDVKPFPYKKN